MPTAKQDINDFNQRIKRIKSPRNKSYYDENLGMHVPKRVNQDRLRRSRKQDSALGAFLVSMIIGAVGLMFAQAIRIRYFGLTEPSQLTLYLELFLTFWAVVMLTALLNRRRLTERMAQIVGVALMMVAGHNLIWRFPDQMAVIYTAAHVEQVMDTLPQHSIVYRGSVYGL